MIILGDKETAAEKINVRRRDGRQLGTLNLDDFSQQLTEEIKEKLINFGGDRI